MDDRKPQTAEAEHHAHDHDSCCGGHGAHHHQHAKTKPVAAVEPKSCGGQCGCSESKGHAKPAQPAAR